MLTDEQLDKLPEFHGPGTYRDGSCHIWRRNGRTKKLKTRPEFRVPVKYGLYTYWSINQNNHQCFHIEETCPHNKWIDNDLI
jgi:hypothetical protein